MTNQTNIRFTLDTINFNNTFNKTDNELLDLLKSQNVKPFMMTEWIRQCAEEDGFGHTIINNATNLYVMFVKKMFNVWRNVWNRMTDERFTQEINTERFKIFCEWNGIFCEWNGIFYECNNYKM